MSIAEELHALENILQEPETRSSPEMLSRLLAEDFVEIGSSGAVYDKGQIIEALQEEKGATFTMQDFQVRVLAPGVVLATYRVLRTSQAEGPARLSRRSSIWKSDGGAWRMTFHQGTNVENTQESR